VSPGFRRVRYAGDLSGEIIPSDDGLARIVVHEHPGLGDGAVAVEVLPDEAAAIEKAALRVAVADVYLPGDDEPRRVTLDADSFDSLATDKPMSEILAAARPARPAMTASITPARRTPASPTRAGSPMVRNRSCASGSTRLTSVWPSRVYGR
jgi:hypothetical protein